MPPFLSGVIRSMRMRRGNSTWLPVYRKEHRADMSQGDVLLIDSLDDAVTVPYEREFRLVTDASHIIRLRQDPSTLFDTADSPPRLSPYSTAYLIPRVAENVQIEGLGQAAEAARIAAFMTGQARRLSLEYQDEQTVGVLGEWRDMDDSLQSVPLGFLPDIVIAQLKDIAAEAMPQGVAATIRTLALPGPGRDAEVWCDVWTLEG